MYLVIYRESHNPGLIGLLFQLIDQGLLYTPQFCTSGESSLELEFVSEPGPPPFPEVIQHYSSQFFHPLLRNKLVQSFKTSVFCHLLSIASTRLLLAGACRGVNLLPPQWENRWLAKEFKWGAKKIFTSFGLWKSNLGILKSFTHLWPHLCKLIAYSMMVGSVLKYIEHFKPTSFLLLYPSCYFFLRFRRK